ncbi:transcriptional repressor LexA [Phaeovibrio sulfidiphilus]|uniref:LexA repressor n=1 Tax=Phaeovibrio sulfidiphilus TaxID=1220600 RepID=A0A8J6YQ43_9PROT|nr:transcriptional repressor LexA [Phaeovibrio sulfidiphilus]MBE1237646.1 transcriptional repressor LexA [Phaeovibrio sulfidiphilus]
MLTKKQHQLLTFIEGRLRETGISPSYDEMRDALGLRSKSGIHRLVLSLEERGFIRRLAHKARAVEVLRTPESSAAPSPFPMRADVTPEGYYLAPAPHGFPSQIRSVGDATAPQPFAIPASHVEAQGAPAVSLPLAGKIAAGTPISALNDTTTQVDVPSALIGAPGEHFALTIEGDSMVEAGILDGDTAIIRRCSSADNGTIVVALIDRDEATLKRIQKHKEGVALEPANRHYKVMVYPYSRVEIQGRLVAILREYR